MERIFRIPNSPIPTKTNLTDNCEGIALAQEIAVLAQAVHSVVTGGGDRPATGEVVDRLLQLEKIAKKAKTAYPFEQLLGTWRLCFITGTQKTRQRLGTTLGAGRYLPRWVTIQIAYTRADQSTPGPDSPLERGQVVNSVTLGAVQLSLSGPTQFSAPQNILAFDFTHLTLGAFGRTLYRGTIRGGQTAEVSFYTEPISQQAFFAYFLLSETLMAARGRGGGLALWAKQDD